ncbi:hypothetical protein [Mucilaginibacter auburnensis]|uniref:Universal stress protein family protein n=1 Tax=Mucilaginibacter auburnensis TaxID=1457233 RepID=A0A2H9VUK4_9SPHI|nr:hypothetical protein [Mucilaginibacter auburnensis]PJJ84506.1 hypothetical protein CLV57_1519 [Mucilaginibacter auburnensis]
MKTVLIPTDYRIQSLEYIPHLLDKFHPEAVEVVMVHMMSITDCERELMMLSRRSAEYRHIPEEFYQTCLDLRNEHDGQLKNIRLEFFYGNTSVVFLNFLEANNIDAVLQIPGYHYKKLNKASVDPDSMIKRCAGKITRINALQLEKPQAASQQHTQTEDVQEQNLTEQYA